MGGIEEEKIEGREKVVPDEEGIRENIYVLEIGEHLQFWRINKEVDEQIDKLEGERGFIKPALELMRDKGTQCNFAWWIWDTDGIEKALLADDENATRVKKFVIDVHRWTGGIIEDLLTKGQNKRSIWHRIIQTIGGFTARRTGKMKEEELKGKGRSGQKQNERKKGEEEKVKEKKTVLDEENERVKKLCERIHSGLSSCTKITGIQEAYEVGSERKATMRIEFDDKYVLKFYAKNVEFEDLPSSVVKR